MVEYVIESRTRSGNYLATLPFRDLQGEFFFTKTREIRFMMSKADLNMLSYNEIYPAATEILVRRDGVPIFLGPLWNLSVNSKDEVNCMAQDLSSYFEKRAVTADTKYEGTYGEIAWAIISGTQARVNGDLGITLGTAYPADGPSTKYNADEGQYLSDVLEDLYDGSNGFDWVIDSNRQYHQYYPRLHRPAFVRLEYGGNIQSYSNSIQGKFVGNSVRTIGKDKLLSDTVVDTNSQQKYGLMDYVGEQTGLSNKNLLNDHNERNLARRRDVYNDTTITLQADLVNPFEGDIGYGHVATVVINDGYTQITKDMLCKGFQVFYNKSGKESFTLYMQDLEIY